MGRRDRRVRDAPGFAHRFEDAEVLAELLAAAGSPLTPEEVLERFRAGRAEGAEAGEVIPALFPEAPRFPHPDVARRLFQNLLGLWDASAARDFRLPGDFRGERPPRPAKLDATPSAAPRGSGCCLRRGRPGVALLGPTGARATDRFVREPAGHPAGLP